MLDSLLSPYDLPAGFMPRRTVGLHALAPGQSVTLAEIDGPGCIRHLFLTMQPLRLREQVLRFYWDGEAEPSVECPVSDFFGIGHDLTTAEMRSPLFYVAPHYGYNCYIPMPFAKAAKITLTNESAAVPVAGINCLLNFHVYHQSHEIPFRFHAVWRRVFPAYRRGMPLTLLEARGRGRVLGVIYHVCKRDSDDRWSHGGGEQMFMDGDTSEPAYLYGMGGEDFAHHAWGLSPGTGPFSGAHLVHPLPGIKRAEGPSACESHGWEQHDGGLYSMYRYFLPDPVHFRSSIRLIFGTMANEISATTYWYQDEPHAAFSKLPPVGKRAFGSRLSEEETHRPLDLGLSIPVGVLGPFRLEDEATVWSPRQVVNLKSQYDTSVRQPYGDVVRPPYRVRWRRSVIHGGFLDLAAIHRPKRLLRARGLWNFRNLPVGIVSHQLIRVKLRKSRPLLLQVGFEDRIWIWQNGHCVTELECLEPKTWHTQDVALKLDEDWQELVLSHSQERLARWSAWGLYVKFLEQDGSIARDVEFDSLLGLDPTPERYVEPWPPEEPVPCENHRDPLMMV